MSVKIKAKNPSNVLQTLLCDANGRLLVDAPDIEVKADTLNLAVDGLEGLQQTTIDKIILPTALTGSGNLKVSIQELGNEGSERLNVDVGDDITQLPSALTGAGNLKVSLEAMNTSGTGISTSAKQDTTNLKLDHLSDNLDTINSSVGDLATESTLNIIAEEFTKCDTDNITITGGLTGSGNLKVCIQELGNEGSERLNVDIGNAVAQLPTALSGGGRLKIENDISGFATSANQTTINSTLGTINNQFRSQWSNGNGGGTALGPAVATLATEATLLEVEGAVETLEACVASDKVNVNISSGGFDGAITNTHLAELGTAINSAKVDVNISSGGFDGAITHSALTELASALNSDKLDVNISSGNISGFATSAKQDTQETSLNAIETEVKLGQTCEDKEVIDDDAISPETLSIVIDTESYNKIRFYGNTTTSPAVLGGSNLLVYGSNASSGTYYNIPATSFSVQTLTISGGSAIHHIGLTLDNVPRYIKIFNKSNSATYTISKLRMVGSNKMINV